MTSTQVRPRHFPTFSFPSDADVTMVGVSAGNEYLTGLTLYFVGYVLFEVRHQL